MHAKFSVFHQKHTSVQLNNNYVLRFPRHMSTQSFQQTSQKIEFKSVITGLQKLPNVVVTPTQPKCPPEIHLGSTVRYVSFQKEDEVKSYIQKGGLTNNCKPGQVPTNASVVKYVLFNEPSNWFSGSKTLENLQCFISEKRPKDESGFVICIGAAPFNSTFRKQHASILYSQEQLDEPEDFLDDISSCKQPNPHKNEGDVLHSGGDFSSFVVAVFSSSDLTKALAGELVHDILTGTAFEPLKWQKAELETQKALEIQLDQKPIIDTEKEPDETNSYQGGITCNIL
ncbi:TPA: hypothetical protein ACTUT5_000963 [Legionella anisa]|uniref:hypothetical protein n=1 Tax=Legionella anisa TaxID=28082 RepID=UPI00197E284F|nr:hypothetical protein [Legionella anisa]MBN5935541.1 hypothetical protein [Legionella anisa]